MAAVKKNTCGDTKYTLQDASSGASIFLGGLEAAERACKSNEHMSASSSASGHAAAPQESNKKARIVSLAPDTDLPDHEFEEYTHA